MTYTPLYLPIGFTALLIMFTTNLVASFAVALFIGSKRFIGFWSSLFIGLVASAIIGLIITLFFKPKKQKQIEKAINSKLSCSPFKWQEFQHLKMLKQSGIISYKEYEQEIDRLLKS